MEANKGILQSKFTDSVTNKTKTETWKAIRQKVIYESLPKRNLDLTSFSLKYSSKCALRTFARKFSNIDFFLKILPLKDDELVMSEM